MMALGSLSSCASKTQAPQGSAKKAAARTVYKAPQNAEKLHPTANLSYKVAGRRYYPQAHVKNFVQTGRASWYGPGFHGRKTSSGERFNMNQLTAAHPTLPIPSYARVTNLATGKSVIVRINDRGPFHGNRAIDLSKAAASQLGFLKSGTAQVRIEQVPAPKRNNTPDTIVAQQQPDDSTGKVYGSGNELYVSLRTFADKAEAQAFQELTASRLSAAKLEQTASLVEDKSGYIVRVGPFAEQRKADEMHSRLNRQNVI